MSLDVKPKMVVKEVVKKASRLAKARGFAKDFELKGEETKYGNTKIIFVTRPEPRVWLGHPVTGEEFAANQSLAQVGLEDGDCAVLCLTYPRTLRLNLMAVTTGPEHMFGMLQLDSGLPSHDKRPRLWGAQGSGVFRECPHFFLLEVVEAEGLGGSGVVAPQCRGL
jgi:hypothetical protein